MKLITLKKLILHNFMAYRDIELDFHGKDITGILAEYEDDNTRSNRGGKSTIIEAIGYNLTGLSRTKDEAKLIHHGMKEMWVTGIYTDGEKDYTVKRGRDHKSKGILEIDWFQKHDESKAEIERLFGITPKDFHLTSYFKQADTEGFMKMKPTEQANFLMQWLDNEHWREKEKLANEDRKVVKEKLRDNENLKKALEASLEIDESLESDKYLFEKENKGLEEQKEVINEKLGAVNNKLNNIVSEKEGTIAQISKLKSEKKDIQTALDNIEADTSTYNKYRQNYAEAKAKLEKLGNLADKKEINSTLDDLRHERSEIMSFLTSSKKSTGVCPVLNEPCDRVAPDLEAVGSSEVRLEEVKNAIKELETHLTFHELKVRYTHEMEIAQQKGIRAKEKLTKEPQLHERLKEIEDTLPELSESLEELNTEDLLNSKRELVEEISNLNKKIKDNSNKILDAEVRISEAKRAKAKIDTVVASNHELQQKLSLLNYTCFMFSKNGIPALEIENSFQEIEDNINFILGDLLPGVVVNFSPDKELKALEPMCVCGYQFPKGFRGGSCPECDTPRQKQRREEISFKVMENGVEQDFEMDSGGGKQVISYAVRIALTMLKRAQRKCNLNMLFLDEVDSALDPYLAAQIISSVTNFLTKKLGYEQVILVSHKEQIKSSVPYIIKVTKHQDYSTARFI